MPQCMFHGTGILEGLKKKAAACMLGRLAVLVLELPASPVFLRTQFFRSLVNGGLAGQVAIQQPNSGQVENM